MRSMIVALLKFSDIAPFPNKYKSNDTVANDSNSTMVTIFAVLLFVSLVVNIILYILLSRARVTDKAQQNKQHVADPTA